MTVLISVRGLKKGFGTQIIMNEINFDIKKGEKIGLVGRNGAGKTTLANILTGAIKPDVGEIHYFANRLNTGYLMQSTSYIENLIQSSMDEQLLKDYKQISTHLGLKQVSEWDEERLLNSSGGEKTKLALAKVWASNPDLLILDEPTNHLDFEGVEWLIKHLKNFDGTIVIISHDRYFLDQTVERIIELEDSQMHDYSGNYSDYRKEKERNYKNQLHLFEEQKKLEGKIQSEITQLKKWSNKAHEGARKKAIETGMKFGGKEFYRAKAKKRDKQVKSKIKRLEKLHQDGVTKPKEEQKVVFDFKAVDKNGKRMIEVSGLYKRKGEKNLFKNSSFYIKSRERIGLVGPNGCGKTTLIEMFLGRGEIDQGEIWISPTATVGYLSQDVLDLDGEKTAIDVMKGNGLREDELQGRTILTNMGFTNEMLEKPMKNLSLGERTKIKLARLLIEQYPILILDEPTNHLDLPSREQLEKTLLDYNGTLIIVSHDRYTLEKLCDRLIVFKGTQLKRYECGFNEYMARSQNRKVAPKLDTEERRMILDNKITRILGLLQKYKPETEEYIKLDQEFKELIKEKRELG